MRRSGNRATLSSLPGAAGRAAKPARRLHVQGSMTYEETEGAIVRRSQARAEIARHDADWYDFLADVGDSETYHARAVLDWLGY